MTPLFHGQGYLELTQTDINNNISRLVDTQRQVEISFYNIPDRYNTELQAAFEVVGMPKTSLLFPTNKLEFRQPIPNFHTHICSLQVPGKSRVGIL